MSSMAMELLPPPPTTAPADSVPDEVLLPLLSKHLSLRRHQQVDVLQHVQEQLIASVFDALAAPSNLTSHLVGYLRGFLFGLGFDSLLGYVRLQDAHIRVLRFINENKIVFYVFLAYFAKVRLHYFHSFVQKFEAHGRIYVLFGHHCYPNLVLAMLTTGKRTCCLAWMTLTLKASTAFRLYKNRK
ncbi:hypothetical protein BpHYR1_039298 [Brachionus plicatilis]|uniref:Uncharacterized protein n=1 Tax=Brachionus plicatilis TaxID=10195 RepID=A0A3M7QF38_BRAPC|nr:hypothetical protein BpHYR1_039298 [Brachionus plicatilis]